MTRLELQEHPPETTKAVSLVDTDIHPVMLPAEMQRRLSTRWARHLERYGRRAPHVTDLYPRPRNKGMRADSWPDGGVPGSDYELAARAAPRRARRRLRDPAVPQRPGLGLRPAGPRRGPQPRAQRLARRGVARP